MDTGLVDPSRLAPDLVVHDQKEALWELRMSLACVNSGGTSSSRVKVFEEAADSDPEGGDEGMEIDLDKEPGSLLYFLNAWGGRLL